MATDMAVMTCWFTNALRRGFDECHESMKRGLERESTMAACPNIGGRLEKHNDRRKDE
jgi:hypothetical protein